MIVRHARASVCGASLVCFGCALVPRMTCIMQHVHIEPHVYSTAPSHSTCVHTSTQQPLPVPVGRSIAQL